MTDKHQPHIKLLVALDSIGIRLIKLSSAIGHHYEHGGKDDINVTIRRKGTLTEIKKQRAALDTAIMEYERETFNARLATVPEYDRAAALVHRREATS